jgi:acetyl esterase
VSTEQRETLDAILRQGAFPADAGVDEQRRLLRELLSALPLPAEVTVAEAALGGVRTVEITVDGIEPHHIVLYFHGGVYVLGDAFLSADLASQVGRRTSAKVISVDYRLAPEHPYPAAVDDAWTATHWAAARFEPVVVGGDSAGGHLAAVVALRARDQGLHIALQVLVYPVTDHAFDTASYREHGRGTNLTEPTMRWFWRHFLGDEQRGAEPEASPLRAPDLTGVAPALVLTAEHDPLREEGEAYAQRLVDAGVPTTLTRYDGLIHGFLRMPAVLDAAGRGIDQVAAAIGDAARAAAPVR